MRNFSLLYRTSLTDRRDSQLRQTPSGKLTQAQFFPPLTKREQWFAVICGILLPTICVIADPLVFKQSIFFGGLGGPLFQRFTVFGYLEIFIGMTALTIFLWRRPSSPFLAGTLAVGAVFSFVLGIVLLPFSMIGLLFVIGVLGFTPFLSGIVFAKASRHVWRTGLLNMRKSAVTAGASVGIFFALVIPIICQRIATSVINTAVQRILAEPTHGETQATLRMLSWATDLNPIVTAYQSAKDEARKEALARAYEEITGVDIKRHIAELND